MDSWSEIVARAIDHTERILAAAPSYRGAAIDGLERLRDRLAASAPLDPALQILECYLSSLIN